jgi:hypothetical protein
VWAGNALNAAWFGVLGTIGTGGVFYFASPYSRAFERNEAATVESYIVKGLGVGYDDVPLKSSQNWTSHDSKSLIAAKPPNMRLANGDFIQFLMAYEAFAACMPTTFCQVDLNVL